MVYLESAHQGEAFYAMGDAIGPLVGDDRADSLVILMKLL